MEKPLFEDDRTRFEHGSLQVQTEFPFYEPGQVVNAIIYMNLKEECPNFKKMVVELKGSAKNSFWLHQPVYKVMPGHGQKKKYKQIGIDKQKLKKASKVLHTTRTILKAN